MKIRWVVIINQRSQYFSLTDGLAFDLKVSPNTLQAGQSIDRGDGASDSRGQGAHRGVWSKGPAENHRVVIDGSHPIDEPIGQRWGMVQPAL